MRRKVTILSIDKQIATVGLKREFSCCKDFLEPSEVQKMVQEGHACSSEKSKNFVFKAFNAYRLSLHAGDEVVVLSDQKTLIFQIFCVLLLPVLLFVGGYFLGNVLGVSASMRLFLGFAGVGVSFLFLILLRRFAVFRYPVILGWAD